MDVGEIISPWPFKIKRVSRKLSGKLNNFRSQMSVCQPCLRVNIIKFTPPKNSCLESNSHKRLKIEFFGRVLKAFTLTHCTCSELFSTVFLIQIGICT